MIPIDVIESTANELMAKAAIEIPDDYLTGLKKAADSEDGDLSSYVLRAMLDNYVAAKEDGRAMCGDTGTPRWYVKMGNETMIEGGPIALVEDGDTIAIDAEAGTIDLLVDKAVLDERRLAWQPREHDYQSGALWRYAQNVGPAHEGAVTHPGAARETHMFADI